VGHLGSTRRSGKKSRGVFNVLHRSYSAPKLVASREKRGFGNAVAQISHRHAFEAPPQLWQPGPTAWAPTQPPPTPPPPYVVSALEQTSRETAVESASWRERVSGRANSWNESLVVIREVRPVGVRRLSITRAGDAVYERSFFFGIRVRRIIEDCGSGGTLFRR